MKNNQERLDLLLLSRGLVSTRSKAADLIAAGKVRVNGKPVEKAGAKFSPDCEITLDEAEHPYVSRGGLKLARALEAFGISVRGLRALDVGQSTGGFTHCLLLAGASEVVGVDVGTGQLDPSLRADPRVRVIEKCDVRKLRPDTAGAPFSFFAADLSFISSSLVLPSVRSLLAEKGEGVLLVKPQFELSPDEIGSGGIVRSSQARENALARVRESARAEKFTVAGECASPILGGDGNQEYLFHLRWPS